MSKPSISAADMLQYVLIDPSGDPIGLFHGMDRDEVIQKFDARFGKGACESRLAKGYRIAVVRCCPMTSARARSLLVDLDFVASQGMPAAVSSYARLVDFLKGHEHMVRVAYRDTPAEPVIPEKCQKKQKKQKNAAKAASKE